MDRAKCDELDKRINKLEITQGVLNNRVCNIEIDTKDLVKIVKEAETSKKNRDWAVIVMLATTLGTVLWQLVIK